MFTSHMKNSTGTYACGWLVMCYFVKQICINKIIRKNIYSPNKYDYWKLYLFPN